MRSERGEALIDGLLMLGVVVLVVLVAIQALFYAHARSVAQSAAQDGARAAATQGTGAGLARASAILGAAGGTAAGLRPSAQAGPTAVTVHVDGHAPRIFGVSLFLPSVSESASLPLERYPEEERAR
ncbi:MAG: TadE/TadG family type IV pilus assembly protein [Solirubrobacteraceae bacterium]